MKPRVYTDTSVLGGCEDDEFREPSRRLLQAFVGGELTLVLSELTLRELEAAPEGVRMVVGRVPQAHIEPLSLSSEAEDLAAAYIEDGAIGAHMRGDALHIALATVLIAPRTTRPSDAPRADVAEPATRRCAWSP